MNRILCFLVIISTALISHGCRQAPATPKQYYDRELAEMKRLSTKKEEPFLSDRYPWQGKTRGIDDRLPIRVLSAQAEIDAEIKRLNRVVHGEPKPCCRDRCCWWHKEKCNR